MIDKWKISFSSSDYWSCCLHIINLKSGGKAVKQINFIIVYGQKICNGLWSHYVDVIGQVVEKDIVKETVKDGKSNKVLDATLEDLEGSRIHCTLWDDFAVKMQQSLDSHDSSLSVVVVFQLCKLKKYFGNIYLHLNAYPISVRL